MLNFIATWPSPGNYTRLINAFCKHFRYYQIIISKFNHKKQTLKIENSHPHHSFFSMGDWLVHWWSSPVLVLCKPVDSPQNRVSNCPACRTSSIATRFFSGGDLSHYQVPHCIRVFFYFVRFVFIHHNFQFYFELCTYCNILDIYLS